MQAVAVGGFHDQQVGPVGRFGVAHQRMTGLAEIAGEQQLAGAAAVLDPDFDEGRTEDVAGVAEAAAHGRMRSQVLVVAHAAQALQRFDRLVHGVERGRFRVASTSFAVAMAHLPLRLLLLDVRAVGQHDFEQVRGGFGAIDRAPVVQHREPWQQARMIDVRVREQHEVDIAHVEVDGLAVLAIGVAPALEHSAIDEE